MGVPLAHNEDAPARLVLEALRASWRSLADSLAHNEARRMGALRQDARSALIGPGARAAQ